ncbi:hypothetical protein ACMGDH_01605 [Sphingomonas sp. DT-207]|uniref:hypothetical protein n=1 Tax=Sphingomonas sp. DT-207 TaxID=3396167 RepID=UPI003F1AF399
MATLAKTATPSGTRPPSYLAVVIVVLAGFTDIKIGDIQTVEIVVIGALGLLLFNTRARLRVHGPAVVIDMLPHALMLLGFALVISLFSMRLDFYPIPDTGPLKQPPLATFARLFEIAISISAMFIVALAISTSASMLKKVFAAYVWAAYIGAAWGIVSMIGWLFGAELSGATPANIPRVRGFFGEGGPFGLYLVGALLINIFRYKFLGYINQRSFWIGSSILFLALLGAQSKSAAFLVLFLAGAYMVVTRRTSTIIFLLPIAIPFLLTSDIVQGVNGYLESREKFAVLAFTNPEDYNLVMGRVMASILLPRIIEAHPFLGIGVGNYSLVRNDPSLLRGLPQVDLWDLQGLGLLGYAAELGIPLTLYVMYVYLIPFRRALSTRPWIATLCIYPLGAALFGVQLSFAYPWVVMGMGLGAIAIHNSAEPRPAKANVADDEGRGRSRVSLRSNGLRR